MGPDPRKNQRRKARVALLIFVAGIWIIYEAILKLIHREPLDAPLWGIVIMLISAVANFIVSRMLFKVGKETDSRRNPTVSSATFPPVSVPATPAPA
ncbi:MAG: cation transporter [Acidobacteria bacterium]|nr:cation transporter [Acidobacteriota bacterium]